jgi:uncharacterized membrane protein
MRRILDSLSLAVLGLILLDTWLAILGPSKLPAKAPIHLNDLGQPDAWTTHNSFEVLALTAVIVYLALTVVAAYSSLAKHAAQADPEAGPSIEPLFLKLIVSIKAELLGIFACIQFSSIHAARHPDDPSSVWGGIMWTLFAAILGTVAWFITSMIRMERAKEKLAS